MCECGRTTPSFGLVGQKRKDAAWCGVCRPKQGAVNLKHGPNKK